MKQFILGGIGALTGLAGTGVFAWTLAPPFVTFILFSISTAAWIAYAVNERAGWLLAMNIGFAIFNVAGLVNHWPGLDSLSSTSLALYWPG